MADLTCIPRRVEPKPGLNYLHLIENPPSPFSRHNALLHLSPALLPESHWPLRGPTLCPWVYPGPTMIWCSTHCWVTWLALGWLLFPLFCWDGNYVADLGQPPRKQILREDLSTRGLLGSWFQEAPVRCVEVRQASKNASQGYTLGRLLSQFWESIKHTSEYCPPRGVEVKDTYPPALVRQRDLIHGLQGQAGRKCLGRDCRCLQQDTLQCTLEWWAPWGLGVGVQCGAPSGKESASFSKSALQAVTPHQLELVPKMEPISCPFYLPAYVTSKDFM